jgi:hypothetical protein
MKKWKQIFLSVWLPGLIITVPLVLLLPDIFSKYKIDLIAQEPVQFKDAYKIYFEDLDGSGVKQKVTSFCNSSGQLSVQFHNDNGGMVNQINFRNAFSEKLLNIFFGDVNGNGYPEIYGFTMKNDSMYLNWNEPYPLQQVNPSGSHFIAKIGTFENGKIDISIERFIIADLENDGKNEILFSIITGYSKKPRIVVLFQPETGKLMKSKDRGINSYRLILSDLDNNGISEIVAGNHAGYNLTDSLGKFIDDRPRLQVFDSNLNDFFAPVDFSEGITNGIYAFIHKNNDRNELVVFQINRSLDADKIIQAFKVSTGGQKLDSIYFPDYGKRFACTVFQDHDAFILYTGNRIVWINDELSVKRESMIDHSYTIFRNPEPGEHGPEYVTRDISDKKAVFYTKDFRHSEELEYEDETIRNILFDAGYGPGHFLVQTDANEYTHRFGKNRFWFLQYPLYTLIWLLSVSFIWFIQKIREKQLKEKFELRNQVQELELRHFRNQMDPHFMFNTLTSVAALLKKGSRDEAYIAFMKFSKLIRLNLEHSQNIIRPLKDELQLVASFLEMNKLRFGEFLQYSVNIPDKQVLHYQVPRMVLQIHVENALKHGLNRKQGEGIVKVSVIQEDSFIRLLVEDNGIGREMASLSNRPSTKQGLKILNAIYERLNRENREKIRQQFTDLKDEKGNPAGTRVEIWLPLNLKE